MTTIQFIERDGRAEFAVVPIEIWNRVAPLIEDLDDEALFDQAKAADDGLHCQSLRLMLSWPARTQYAPGANIAISLRTR